MPTQDDETNAHVLLRRLLRWAERQHQEDSPRWQVRSSSELARDDAATHPFRLSHAALGARAVALDHLRTMRLLLVPDDGSRGSLPAFAAYSLVRGALENAAAALWLLGPEEQSTRVLRRLRWEATNAANRTKFVHDAGLTPRTGGTSLGSLATAAGLDAREATKRVASTAVLGEVTDHLPGYDHPFSPLVAWEAASGFAHGRSWALLTFSDKDQLPRRLDSGDLAARLTANLVPLWTITHPAAVLIEAADARWSALNGPGPSARRLAFAP